MLLLKIKIMPNAIEVDLEKLKDQSKEIIESFDQKLLKDETEPIAFGLKALMLFSTWPDDKGADELEEKISALENVKSASIIDVRKAIG